MLIDILRKEASGAKLKLGLVVVLPGIADAAVIVVLQDAVRAGGDASPGLFISFCLLCVVQLVCLRQSVSVCATIIETVLYKMRSRIADKLRRAEPQGLQQIGDAEVYNRLIQA